MYIARQVSASLSSRTNYPVSTYNHHNLSDLLSKTLASTTFEKIHFKTRSHNSYPTIAGEADAIRGQQVKRIQLGKRR